MESWFETGGFCLHLLSRHFRNDILLYHAGLA